MTERLADVSAHLYAVRQVGAVVNAMRGMAASRAQQAHALLPSVRAYAEVTTRAIGQALGLPTASGADAARSGGAAAEALLVVFGTEQGFAGGLADRILEAAAPFTDAAWLMIGARTASLARERGLTPVWDRSLPARAAALPAVAAEVAEALYGQIASTGASRVDVLTPVWAAGGEVRLEKRALLPLDLSRYPRAAYKVPPLTALPAATLLERLTEEYVYARLCEAAVEAYVAENQARKTAMANARRKIDEQVVALQQREHRIRQEEITAEVIELCASNPAVSAMRARPSRLGAAAR